MKKKIAKTEKARRGIIYVRVSSDEQVNGTSLDDQEARCIKYCQENDIEIMGEPFRDEGQSAKSANRPKLIEAIEFCRRNKGLVDAFVVYKLDRFSRNMEDHILVKIMLSEPSGPLTVCLPGSKAVFGHGNHQLDMFPIKTRNMGEKRILQKSHI